MPTPEARKSRKRLQWLVSICGAIAAIALLGAGLALKQSRDIGRSSRSALCQEEQKTRGAVRAILTDARAETIQHIPPGQRPAMYRDAKRDDPRTPTGEALAFYRRHLARLSKLDCGQIIKKGATP